MAGMRRLIAVAIVFAGVAFPAFGQRGVGASRGGGGTVSHGTGFASHSAGFAVHSAPAFRSSAPMRNIAPMVGRRPYLGSPQTNSYRYTAASPDHRTPSRGSAAGYPGRVGDPGRRNGYRGDDRYRRPYFGAYAVGYPSGFTIWPGALLGSGLYDPSFYGDSNYGYDDSAYDGNQPAPADYAPQPYPAPPQEQAEVATPSPYRPAYERPEPPPEPESAVTLVFKDGRPTQQIHNYMLTRTTLYVQDGSRREIPVDELDLAATQKANKDAGVDFQLPGARR